MNSAQRDARDYGDLFPVVYLRLHRRDEKQTELDGASRGVLLHLGQSGPMPISECARHLGRAQSVVSEIVAHLERKGLLARVRDAEDRRRHLVWLTDAGRDRLIRDQEVLSRALVESTMRRMSASDRRKLLEGTRALVRACEDLANPRQPTRRSR